MAIGVGIGLVLLTFGCTKRKKKHHSKNGRADSPNSQDEILPPKEPSPKRSPPGQVSYGLEKEPVVTKVPMRDLGDEQNLSWSKLQGTSELEDPEDVFGVAPSKQAPKAVTTDSKTELEECTAKDVSLREADTPPGSSSCDTTARAATPQESKTAVNENPTANPVTDIVSAFLPTTTPQSTQDPAEWKTDVADPNPPSGATK